MSAIDDLPQPLITIHPDLLSGAPAFTGTRVPVSALLDYLVGHGSSGLDEFLADFPNVTRQHAVAVLRAAFSGLSAVLSPTRPHHE